MHLNACCADSRDCITHRSSSKLFFSLCAHITTSFAKNRKSLVADQSVESSPFWPLGNPGFLWSSGNRKSTVDGQSPNRDFLMVSQHNETICLLWFLAVFTVFRGFNAALSHSCDLHTIIQGQEYECYQTHAGITCLTCLAGPWKLSMEHGRKRIF